MAMRYELLGGVARLNATTEVLQRARIADALGGMWEAADVQWWWGRPRDTDALPLPVWFDDKGPVAAAGLTASGESWQVDVFAVPSFTEVNHVWAAAMEAVAQHHGGPLEMLVHEDDQNLIELAVQKWLRIDRRVVRHDVDGR